MAREPKYKLTLSLNVLNHLGINLYSNVPAVLAEVVANSWDADAEKVSINIDTASGRIEISDDGHGMNENDVNEKYLTVGYERRKTAGGAVTAKFGRHVMGRKGIGKLSLFAVAETIEVHSVKNGDKAGFLMTTEAIREQIKDGHGTYYPEEVPVEKIEITKGTRIILTDVKKNLHQTLPGLRKRLARRFSIIGDTYKFSIFVGNTPVTIEDRDYFHKIQYLWEYGGDDYRYAPLCKNLDHKYLLSGQLKDQSDFKLEGWIGTVKGVGQLNDDGESINKIVVMVRGKVAQEDILEEFGEGGVYSKYLIGELNADFLDLDDAKDIATSSRQSIIEDDPRYQGLKDFVQSELKTIKNAWTDLRNADGLKVAQEIPAIDEWYGRLSSDNKQRAKSLFGKINQITVDSIEDRRALLKNGVLAFEHLRYKSNLDALDKVSSENLEALTEIFVDLDDIEASLYHQIIRERVEVIRALNEKVEENALEKIIQEHIFKHLWLLDPSWERATATAYMEQQVRSEFEQIDAGLTDEERQGRVDIKYTTASGKHIIIELKRADRTLRTVDIIEQLTKYRSALRKLLEAVGKGSDQVEFIVVVGRELSDWNNPNGKMISEGQLAVMGARVVHYKQLIDDAYQNYQQFLEKNEEAGKVNQLLLAIDAWDFDA